jgi:MFS family permease
LSAEAPTRPAQPTLAALFVLLAFSHTVLAGSRVAVSLDALHRGASPALVGALVALFSVLPMLAAMPAGRLIDRVGSAPPLWAGTLSIAAGVTLPALRPELASLVAAAPLIGLGFMLTQVAVQHAVAGLGAQQDRTAHFGLLSLGSSIANFAGPLVAGLAIDAAGHRAAFMVLALLPVVPIGLLLTARRLALRTGRAPPPEAPHERMWDLLHDRTLRRLFLVNAFVAIGWDVHNVFLPIYGVSLGLSASQIGMILASFAAASFVVRFAIGAIARRWRESVILRWVFVSAAMCYLALPWVASPWGLMALAFTMGLGLGAGQPVVMSLLQLHAPPQRLAEAAGIRIALIQSMAFSVPLVFGALGTSIGVAAVFWATAACLGAAGAASRRQ